MDKEDRTKERSRKHEQKHPDWSLWAFHWLNVFVFNLTVFNTLCSIRRTNTSCSVKHYTSGSVSARYKFRSQPVIFRSNSQQLKTKAKYYLCDLLNITICNKSCNIDNISCKWLVVSFVVIFLKKKYMLVSEVKINIKITVKIKY
jgi:hypothetical protein